jgi:hypothetical protein
MTSFLGLEMLRRARGEYLHKLLVLAAMLETITIVLVFNIQGLESALVVFSWLFFAALFIGRVLDRWFTRPAERSRHF